MELKKVKKPKTTSEAELRVHTNKPLIKRKNALQMKSDNESTHIITPIDCNSLIINEHICLNKTPKLIIMVPSIPSHTRQRMAIRDTYAKLSHDRIHQINGLEIQHVVGIMFLLGGSGTNLVDENIKKENHVHNDIVQFDFKDSYHNLTLKMLHGFKWINMYCNKTTYVLKVDEDVFVNVALLLKQLEQHPLPSNGAVFGYIYSGAKVWRFGKWAIDKTVYGKNILPRYASGTAYCLTVKLLPDIVKVAEMMPYVKVEDAYITGIIASEKLGATLIMLNGSSHLNEGSIEPCAFVKDGRVTITNLKPRQIYRFWRALICYEQECQQQ
ncbi:beta-1,3-galactosyltransferase 5-like [Mercenaria mercenaria]|uniref:beta-1,3-galactosyltransferase 5-like n=1 Tax=Mercenaria mercenaria TaxID=6596 RepID=UPI00234EB91F|nr:beta-1,3-galactosyltransferase 5-like [Mercenaria mercenaria]